MSSLQLIFYLLFFERINAPAKANKPIRPAEVPLQPFLAGSCGSTGSSEGVSDGSVEGSSLGSSEGSSEGCSSSAFSQIAVNVNSDFTTLS